MLNVRLSVLALASVSFLFAPCCPAGTYEEDFSGDPAARGWRACGNTELFAWSAADQAMRVTWDSSQTNSYFYRPLGTILAKDDDFSLEFDLRLSDIGTTTKPGPFEIAVGFLNLGQATRPDFWRGSGQNAVHGPRSLVEFDYFPAGYYPEWDFYVDPTISPTVVSDDNAHFLPGMTLMEIATNALFHVVLSYSASSQTVHTTMTCNGAPFGPIGNVTLDSSFTDFRLDAVAISSYSDAGDDYDSVLAHGVVDNVVITTPPPPVANVTGGWQNGRWQVQFVSRTNWVYALERTGDFQSWTAVTGGVSGNGAGLVLEDETAPATGAFYRVRAERP